MVEQPNESGVALVVGAGDFIGAAIAKRFAAGGFVTAVGRRNAGKLAPLVAEIAASGGAARGFARDPAALAPDTLMKPSSIGEAYWMRHQQPRDAWTHELDVRPYAGKF
jgi:NAD(P)-dependent dehydrogenase (short-subunit alcohol dehydrogenase family)